MGYLVKKMSNTVLRAPDAITDVIDGFGNKLGKIRNKVSFETQLYVHRIYITTHTLYMRCVSTVTHVFVILLVFIMNS